MSVVELNFEKLKQPSFTETELQAFMAIVKSSPLLKEKAEESKRFISKLMEKYPDLEDRLSGKVPHP